MTTNNKGATWAIVILIGLMLLLAFRSIFFVLPFGFFPGVTHVFRGAGEAVGGAFRFFPLMFLPLALFVLWAFIIVWVYRDAQKRGMNGLLWALLVLIGNIVGLIIFLIIRNESVVRPQAGCCEKCPNCGQAVGAGFTYCPHCGRPMTMVCPSCKKPVEAGWKVCPHCGTSLDAGKTEQA